MFSASAWAILVQFLFAPIISRIYDPEVYGLFSIFNSWVVVLGVFATLSYSQAFVLPERPRVFRALLQLALRSVLVVSIASTVLALLLWETINSLFNAEELGYWTLGLGALVLLMALDRVMIDWSVREKAFKKQSLISIPVTIGAKGFNVAYGALVSSTVEGLIITNAIHYASRIFLYFKKVIPNAPSVLRKAVSREERQAAASEYKAYPRYQMWSNALGTASNYLPIVLLPIFLDSAEPAGLFAYALIVLDLPARLLGAGVNPVFLQKAVELNRTTPERLAGATWKLFLTLIFLVIIPLVSLGVLGELAYGFVFGEKWEQAGLLAAIMGGYYFFRLTSSPISSIFNVKRRERSLFWFQLMLFSFRLGALIAACMILSSLVEIIVVFTAANALAYWILTGWIFSLLKKYVWQSMLVSGLTFCLLAYLVVCLREILL